MGEMGRATCIVCGRELPVEEMESIFIGRTRYRCFKCVSNGNKQSSARVSASLANGYAKKMKERNRWK